MKKVIIYVSDIILYKDLLIKELIRDNIDFEVIDNEVHIDDCIMSLTDKKYLDNKEINYDLFLDGVGDLSMRKHKNYVLPIKMPKYTNIVPFSHKKELKLQNKRYNKLINTKRK